MRGGGGGGGKNFAAVTFFPFSPAPSSPSSSLPYPEPVTDRRVDLDGFAVEHLKPLSGYLWFEKRGHRREKRPVVFFVSVFFFLGGSDAECCPRKHASSSALSLSLSFSLSFTTHTAWGLLVGLSPTRVSIGARRLVL